MIIDAHVKIGPSFDKKGVDIEGYIEEMEKNGIDKAVLCPNKPRSYSVEEGNAYVADAVKADPERFYGAFRIDPWEWEEKKEEIMAIFPSAVFRFLYLNPWEETFRINDEVVWPIFDFAKDQQLPVIIETGYPYVSHITQIAEMSDMYPDVKFITTTAAQIDLSGFTLSDVSWALAHHDNIYVGTAAAVGAEWLANQAENNAKGRVLFETGFPQFDPHMEKYRIEVAYTDAAHKEEIFSGNLLALLA